MTFFAFGTNNMSRTELDAFARSAREWEHQSIPVTRGRRRRPTTPSVARANTAAETPARHAVPATTGRPVVRPAMSSLRRALTSPLRVVTRTRRSVLERSRGRFIAP